MPPAPLGWYFYGFCSCKLGLAVPPTFVEIPLLFLNPYLGGIWNYIQDQKRGRLILGGDMDSFAKSRSRVRQTTVDCIVFTPFLGFRHSTFFNEH